MPFLAPTLDYAEDYADPLFDLMITPDFYLHHVQVADQNPANGSYFEELNNPLICLFIFLIDLLINLLFVY